MFYGFICYRKFSLSIPLRPNSSRESFLLDYFSEYIRKRYWREVMGGISER